MRAQMCIRFINHTPMSPRDKVRHSTALEIHSVLQTPEKSCPYERYIEGKWTTASNTCLNVIDELNLPN